VPSSSAPDTFARFSAFRKYRLWAMMLLWQAC
jgi:hypothetical protein